MDITLFKTLINQNYKLQIALQDKLLTNLSIVYAKINNCKNFKQVNKLYKKNHIIDDADTINLLKQDLELLKSFVITKEENDELEEKDTSIR
ncbi:MAG: hypothetical protein QXO65_03590 [Candidatus Aenigmatarchaeota archaeon]